MENKGYGLPENNKKMQDLLGIRISLYFKDDCDIVSQTLKSLFKLDNESRDIFDDNVFNATRHNLVFRLPDDYSNALSFQKNVDTTFEVQVRTILSEGWHEVDHSLRYKNTADWKDKPELSRFMNGFLATLETSELGMLQLFNELSYRHYQEKKWDSMIRSKFRLRIQDTTLCNELRNILDSHNEIAKSIYKVNRMRFLEDVSNMKITVPITLDNIIYMTNLLYIKEICITDITPRVLFV